MGNFRVRGGFSMNWTQIDGEGGSELVGGNSRLVRNAGAEGVYH